MMGSITTVQIAFSVMCGAYAAFPFYKKAATDAQKETSGWIFLGASVGAFYFFQLLMCIAGLILLVTLAPHLLKALRSSELWSVIQNFRSNQGTTERGLTTQSDFLDEIQRALQDGADRETIQQQLEWIRERNGVEEQ